MLYEFFSEMSVVSYNGIRLLRNTKSTLEQTSGLSVRGARHYIIVVWFVLAPTRSVGIKAYSSAI